MKKIISLLFLALISGCTVTTTPSLNNTNSSNSWCTESIINFIGGGMEGEVSVVMRDVNMPDEMVSMCCVESGVIGGADYAKFCTTNPMEYDEKMWMYSEAMQNNTLIKSYTYTNETHGCIDLYNSTSKISSECYKLQN